MHQSLGKKKIYAGGTTIAAHTVKSVQVAVLVERAKGRRYRMVIL